MNSPSIKEFDFVQEAGFKNTYNCIEKVMKYYNEDSETCCKYFREVLESALNDIYKILNDTKPEDTFEQIKNLKNYPLFPKEDLITELHNIRIIANNYNHFSEEEKNPTKDRYTCYCAILKIEEWIVNFSKEYPIFLEEERKKTYSNPSPDQPKEKNKESSSWPIIIIAIIACICFPVAIIAAIIWLIQKFNK
ncbi:MAG: hypothetical protein J6C46_00060 [Clostridia bacterium]|nr:hypothetical protein [Clostridia bacterium]